MATIGNHQQSAFTEPYNTQSPIDADQVTANDNALRGTYNAHDSDPTIHIQSSVLSSRPSAGTLGQTWLVTDQMKLYYDTGSVWDGLKMDASNLDTGTVPSARLSGSYTGITAVGTLASLSVTGSATIGTGLTVTTGGATITGNSTITGTLGGITTLTATTLGGTLSTAAQPNVTSLGTLTGLTVSGNASVSGTMGLNGITYTFPATQAANRFLKTDGSGALTWAVAGDIAGSGTADYVTRWTATNTIGNSIIRDDGTNVGINTAPNASYRLDVSGNVRASGTVTLNGITYTFPASQTPNYVLKTDGSGNLSWAAGSSSAYGRIVTVFTATAGQTSFTVTYTPGYVDVYLNGLRLLDGTDFTATNGTSVVLTTGAALNDEVVVIALDAAVVTGGITGSGTTGKLIKFTGLTTGGDSIVTETGAELDVAGNVDLATSYAYKINGTNVLTATALGTGVTSSSLTSVGTLTGLTVSGTATFSTPIANASIAQLTTAGKVANSATTATSLNTASAIVARDASGNFSAGTITATLSGAATSATTAGSVTNALSAGSYLTSAGTYNGSAARTFAVDATSANTANKVVARDASGNFSAGTITATLSGSATSAGSVTNALTAGSYLTSGGTYNGSAARTFAVDATSANTASKVVARDASGNFAAGTITASLSGNATSATTATTATTLATARNINGVAFNGSADITITAAAGTLTGSTLASGVTSSSLTSVGTLGSLTVSGTATLGTAAASADGTAGAPIFTRSTDTNTGLFFPAADVLAASTAGTERARISATGWFKASNNGSYISTTGAYHEFNGSSNSSLLPTLFVNGTGSTTPGGIFINFTASPDNNTAVFLTCEDGTAARCYIYSDGDLANHDGVYGSISDERLKQDIVDAGSQWNDLKAVRFRKYRMKTDVEANPNAPYLLGVVAQELELVSPGLVEEHPNADGTTTKTVKSSILLTKAAVALQEAMARIEALEARLAVLEAK